jgi:Predicted transcriptional regulators
LKFWLAKSSEVPLREQLATQIIMGIVSGDLATEERLPSTRDLARRFGIHSNTVSAVYRELAGRGWVEFRKGSGVYVSNTGERAPLETRLELDQLISSFLQVARSRGFSLAEVQKRVRQWMELQPPDQFLVIAQDKELRAILAVEVREATGFRVAETDLEGCARSDILTGSIPLTMVGQVKQARAALPPDTALLVLKYHSVPESLKGEEAPPPDALITVASRWPEFLKWSRAILVAAGVNAHALSFRDARQRHWEKGLRSSTFVITDALTARSLPQGCRARIFNIIADSSLDELRLYVRSFLGTQPDAD